MHYHPSKILRFILFLFLFSVGVVSFLPFLTKKPILYDQNYQTFSGVVVKEPDIRINHTKLTIQPDEKSQSNFTDKVLVSVGLYPQYQYGDYLEINCRIKNPEAFNGFAYDRYLAKQGIYALCSRPRVKLIESGQGNFVFSQLLKIKSSVQQTINQNLHEPQASLLSALILGSRRGIPTELADQFRLTGTSHLIAISGLHIILLITILQQTLITLGLWRQQAFWAVTIILIFYLAIIGFPASAVRASIMGWMLLLAQQLGRQPNSTNAILLAASLMLLHNPKLLRDDIGFQLSFCAVLGIGWFAPRLERWLKFIPSTLGMRSIMQMSLAAQFATAPLIIYHFGQFSLIGVITNAFVIPLMPYVMITGILSLIIGSIISTITVFVFWPVWLLLSYLIQVVNIFSLIPFASIAI